MTSRGIYEWILSRAFDEYKQPKSRFVASSVCEHFGSLVGKNDPPNGIFSKKIYDIYSLCRINTAEKAKTTYQDLCNEIHGYPWHGPNVKVYFKKLPENSSCRCLLPKIAEFLALKIEKDDEE